MNSEKSGLYFLSAVIRASSNGVFRPAVRDAYAVAKNGVLGELMDAFGEPTEGETFMHSIIRRPCLGQLDCVRRVLATALLVMVGSLASASSVAGEAFPDFSAYDQNGVLFELSDTAWDGKFVIIHVCAIWCKPCRILAMDYAAIVTELDDSLGADNYLFMDLLLYDQSNEDTEQADAAAWAELGNNPLVLHVDGATGIDEVKSFLFPGDTETFPTTVVLDVERNVAGLLEGYSDNVEAFATEIVQAVDIDFTDGFEM